jgi:hypothetical protein
LHNTLPEYPALDSARAWFSSSVLSEIQDSGRQEPPGSF